MSENCHKEDCCFECNGEIQYTKTAEQSGGVTERWYRTSTQGGTWLHQRLAMRRYVDSSGKTHFFVKQGAHTREVSATEEEWEEAVAKWNKHWLH